MSETLHTCPTCQTPGFTTKGLKAHKCRGVNRSSSQPVEVVTAAEVTRADLRASADRINQTIELIKGHQDAFEDATLEHRLVIGLEIARAQKAFGMSVQDAGKLGGRPREETVPTVGKVSVTPLGFSNWIKKEIPDLPRSTAQRYAISFQSLGLPADGTTPAKIKAKLKDLRHQAGKAKLPMPTLAMLYKQSKPAPSKEPLKIEGPKDTPQMRLEDAREAFHVWTEQFETMLRRGQLDDLDKPGLENLKEFLAGARDRINKRLR